MSQRRLPWVDAIPAWYDLCIYDKTTLVVKIHPQAMSLLDRLQPDSPILACYRKEFKLPTFSMPAEGSWGFGEAFRRVEDENGWTVYHCQLPVYRRLGDAEDSATHSGVAVRISLSILFLLLQSPPEHDTDAEVPQLVIVNTLLVKGGLHGGSLDAVFTPGMNRFLSAPDEGSLQSVRDAMVAADGHMWQEKERSRLVASNFRVSHQPPTYIHLSVPGNACQLDPDFSAWQVEGTQRGYRLFPHNVDGGIQQLSLLMGLARLNELGRAKYP